jgi:hypothetical protein
LEQLAEDVKRPGGVDWEGEAAEKAIAREGLDVVKARPYIWGWDDVTAPHVRMSMFAVFWISALQSQVAASQLGRVFAVDQLTVTALAPVGLAIAGRAVAVVGTSPTAWVAVAVLVGSVVATPPISGVVSFADPAADREPALNQPMPRGSTAGSSKRSQRVLMPRWPDR